MATDQPLACRTDPLLSSAAFLPGGAPRFPAENGATIASAMPSDQDSYSIPASQAARQLGVHIQTITNAIDAGEIDAKIVARGSRRTRLLKQETVDELTRTRCSYPGCEAIAPGRSGRCGAHRAGVKYAAERRSCKGCSRDLGVIPGSRIREGRGIWCDECWPRVRDARLAKLGPIANPEGAREHHRQVAAEVARMESEEGLLTPQHAAALFGVRKFSLLWRHHYRGELPAEVHHIHGSPRLLIRADALDDYIRDWVRGGDARRLSWFEPDIALARWRGRGLVSTLAEEKDLTETEATALMGLRIKERRTLLRRRTGRRKNSERRERWLLIAERVVAKASDLTLNDLIGEISHQDWSEQPADWPGYIPSPTDSRSLDPGQRKAAVERIRSLVGAELKALQSTSKETTSP